MIAPMRFAHYVRLNATENEYGVSTCSHERKGGEVSVERDCWLLHPTKKRGCGTSNGSCRTVGVAEYCGSELGIRRVPVWSNVGVRWGGGALGVLSECAGSTLGVLGEYFEIEWRCGEYFGEY